MTHLDDEEQPPVRDGGMRLLNTECDQSTEGAGDGSEAKPVRHAQAHLVLGVEEREVQRDSGPNCVAGLGCVDERKDMQVTYMTPQKCLGRHGQLLGCRS